MGRERKPKRVRTRPNTECLCCGKTLEREPNYQRAFYYCSEYCRLNTQRGISALSLSEGKGRKTRNCVSGSQLAMCWFALKSSPHRLSAVQVMERAKDLFGEKVRMKSKSFQQIYHYFNDAVCRERPTKSRPFEYFATDKSLSFKEVLKERYANHLYDN